MAQVIITGQQAITDHWTMWVRTIVIGLISGLVFYELTIILGRYIIDPLVCRQVINAALCADSTPLAGNISAVIVALLGVVSMVRLGVARPIIIAVASAGVLWDLGGWTDGLFWLQALTLNVVLYAFTYSLFGWIIRHEKLWAALVVSILIVAIIRTVVVL